METRRDFQRAARRNNDLRGLNQVPIGVLFIFMSVSGWWFDHVGSSFWLVMAPMGVFVYAAVAIKRRYDESYGRVTPSQRDTVATGVVAVVLAVALMRVQLTVDLPVNPFLIAVALGLLAIRAGRTGLERHHLTVFGALLLAGALPVWPAADAGHHAAEALAGLALIVTGILDHRLLVREFGPARTPTLGNGDAPA